MKSMPFGVMSLSRSGLGPLGVERTKQEQVTAHKAVPPPALSNPPVREEPSAEERVRAVRTSGSAIIDAWTSDVQGVFAKWTRQTPARVVRPIAEGQPECFRDDCMILHRFGDRATAYQITDRFFTKGAFRELDANVYYSSAERERQGVVVAWAITRYPDPL